MSKLVTETHRSYSDDLVNNLSMPSVANPNYLCQQQFVRCNHLVDPKDRQECESFWVNICPDGSKNVVHRPNRTGNSERRPEESLTRAPRNTSNTDNITTAAAVVTPKLIGSGSNNTYQLNHHGTPTNNLNGTGANSNEVFVMSPGPTNFNSHSKH